MRGQKFVLKFFQAEIRLTVAVLKDFGPSSFHRQEGFFSAVFSQPTAGQGGVDLTTGLEDSRTAAIVLQLVPGAALDIRLVGQALEEARVALLADPSGVDRTDLVREDSIDPATGDRRWTTWTLDPGLWTVRVDPGTGDPLVRKVEIAPGPPIELVVP